MAAVAISAPGGNHARRRQWRYTWEALAHLPLLRLYVFPRRPALPAAIPSGSLRADLRLEDSLLFLSFSLAGEDHPVALRVPVPRVLVDPAAPVECRTAGDHVEVRLALVLPVDHPVVATAFPPPHGAEPPAPLAVRDGESYPRLSPLVRLVLAGCSETMVVDFQILKIRFYDSFSWINRCEESFYWRRSLVLQELLSKVDKTATEV